MEENAEEGVVVEVADLSDIDNSETLELIEGNPSGVFALLNEECVVPKGSDASLLDKMFANLLGNKRLKRPLRNRTAFSINHYAATVSARPRPSPNVSATNANGSNDSCTELASSVA
eukprot:2689156-Pleurochrysis_carterae.AAC.1